ncbi:MAG TPA: hypothetical protein DC057_16865 [Spirochaetia bacterium]|nr:hypothetical protein [Spirochaetia bacterium]
MQLNEYCELANRTNANLETEVLNTLHILMGMQTEIGELTDPFKKQLAYNKPVDWTNVKEELGDLMWYIGNLCYILNFDLEEILEKNIEKLKARYPEKFDSDKAINRNLSKERDILES